jgi:hypothetical protein
MREKLYGAVIRRLVLPVQVAEVAMRRVELSLFELLLEELIDEVASSGEPIIITRDGEPVVTLEPASRALFFLGGAATRP